METAVWIVHVLVALGVIGLVLLQHGKGADMGAAFGSGSSGSLFGATGAANALSRATKILVTVFFLTSMALTYFSVSKQSKPLVAPAQKEVPTSQAPAQVPVSGQPQPTSKAKDIPN
jgi:preprotein translocase subunit SecG